MITTEEFVSTQKANVEALFGLSQKAFEGVEKLVELHVQLAKASLTEAGQQAQAILSVKDAQELLALQASLLQPSAEKAAAYSRHVYEIASSTGAEVSRLAEAKVAEIQKSLLSVVDSAVQNAPAGTENAVALVKSAVAAASNAFETVQKAGKQAAEAVEANIQAMTSSAIKAAQPAKAKRTAAPAA